MEGLIAFCKGIQAAAPVDSYVDPEPWDMPGYDSQVIMAAGAFVQGSSIELYRMRSGLPVCKTYRLNDVLTWLCGIRDYRESKFLINICRKHSSF